MPCPQLVLLSEEKQSLAQENAVLRERVGRPEDEGASGLTAKKLLLLQTQLEQLQEENFRYGQAGTGPADQGPGAGTVPSRDASAVPQAGEWQGGRAHALFGAGAGGRGAAAAEPSADQPGPGGAGSEG